MTYDVMNIQGEIQEDALDAEGTLVTLNAVLTYREDETKQAAYQCTAHLYPRVLSGEEARKQEIEETLAASERKNREEKRLESAGGYPGEGRIILSSDG